MATEPQMDETPRTQVPVSFLDVLRRLEWRTELLAIAIVLAEVSLVWLAFGLLMAETETRAAYPFAVVALVMLAAHYVTHLLDQARVWSPDYEVIMSVSVILTLLIAIKAASFPSIAFYDLAWVEEGVNGLAFFSTDAVRPVWGNVILVVYAWFRGRSREEPSVDSAYTMLRWGTLILAVILILILVGAPASPMATSAIGCLDARPSDKSGRQSLSRWAITATLITSAPVARIADVRASRSAGTPSKSCIDSTTPRR